MGVAVLVVVGHCDGAGILGDAGVPVVAGTPFVAAVLGLSVVAGKPALVGFPVIGSLPVVVVARKHGFVGNLVTGSVLVVAVLLVVAGKADIPRVPHIGLLVHFSGVAGSFLLRHHH